MSEFSTPVNEVAIQVSDRKRYSTSILYDDYEKIFQDRIKEYSTKRDRFKKLYYSLNVSNVILQSSGILSIGSSFYSDDISAKIVAFATNGLSLTLMGLEKLLKTEARYKSYSKRVKAFEKLHLLLAEKRIRGESFDDIKQKLSDLDDTDSYDK